MSELVQILNELIELLRRYGEKNWSRKIEGDLRLLRQDDGYGAKRFLSHYGGMGSFNDLWLCALNGHSVPKDSESAANAELQALSTRAWQLAKEIERNAV